MGNTRPTVRVGVFIPVEAQLLDTACVDIFCVLGHGYMSLLEDLMPRHVVDLAPNVEILYISQSRPGETISLTANMRIVVDRHYSDEDVAPGKLDVVLIPGPDPKTKFEKGGLEWLAAQAAHKGTDILSVCTGIFICGDAGLLKPGTKACGPRGLQDVLKKKHPGVSWQGEKLRWIQDGNFWSSGGVTNGNDLVSAYVRHSPAFAAPLVEIGLMMTDVGDRPQVYGQRQSAFVFGMVWNIVRAWVSGFGKPKVN